MRVYYEDWGSHGCAFGNVCAEHEGREESHMGCGLQGVLRGATVKSHGGHQCLWCDTHHERGDGRDVRRDVRSEQELAVEPSVCRLTAEQARNGHTVHFTKDVVASRGVLSETDRASLMKFDRRCGRDGP